MICDMQDRIETLGVLLKMRLRIGLSDGHIALLHCREDEDIPLVFAGSRKELSSIIDGMIRECHP